MTPAPSDGEPELLAGGNPRVPKGDGDGPVQTYLDAMPGWKQPIGRRLDALITANVSSLRKGVRWNSPFYGSEGRGWFLSFHCFTNYVKVTFFDGSALDPMPPVASKDPSARYVHLTEDEELDDELLVRWITQAAALPGWAG